MSASQFLLDFRHISVVRGGKRILNDLTWQVRGGESVAVLGPNGSGKSTLIKLITRQLYPTADPGSVFRIFGETSWDVSRLQERLGIVSTDARSYQNRKVTGEETILSGFFSSVGLWPHHHVLEKQRKQTKAIMRLLGVQALAGRLVSTLSSGEVQCFLIGRALVHNPSALILDEPTNSLDVRAASLFRTTLSSIARRGKTIILVTHQVADLIPEIERVVLLSGGRIFKKGAKRHVLSSSNLSQLFGVEVDLHKKNGRFEIFASGGRLT